MDYELEKKQHISYCGSYCHHCNWHTGKIRSIYGAALRMFDDYGLKRFIEKEAEIERFRKGLEAISRSSICPGCKAEAPIHKPGEDRCEIRQCCYEQGLDLCCECNDFPCEKLKNNPGVIKFNCLKNLDEIKDKGVREWIDKEWEEYCR